MQLVSYVCRWRPWVVSLVVICTLFFSGGIVSAATTQDITLTPPSVSPIISAGTTLNGSFQIINQGGTGYHFIVYTTPYRVVGEVYTPDFTALPSAPSVSNWIKLSPSSNFISPLGTSTVNYSISVPKNTQPGGYYAAAFAETQLPKASTGISLNERVGLIYYIQVAGKVVSRGDVASWQSSFLQKRPLTSLIRIRNSGSIFFNSTISYKVEDLFRHTKYKLVAEKVIIPQTIRKITIPWNASPGFGLFKVSAQLKFLNKTSNLPTKWVLVISPVLRTIILILVLCFVMFILGQIIFRLRKNKSKKKSN